MNVTANITSATHTGFVRKRNEDSFYVGANLIAVADGMGGHVSGDVASRVAIDAIRPFDLESAPELTGRRLGEAFAAVGTALQREITATPALKGMGTTLVALMWSGTFAIIGNVGDSRAYLLRAGRLHILTDDHLYRRLVARSSTVPTLSDRLSRFLDGRADGRSPDLAPLELEPGDRILLCSDGLSSYVPQPAIGEALALGVDEAPSRLVELALEQGGPDNVTVIVADF